MSNQSKLILGILGAVAAGVAIGLLVAPEKGSDMRKKLKKTTGDWVDTFTNLFNKAKDGMDEVNETVKRTKDTMPTGA
jgi:gas vesicle protein